MIANHQFRGRTAAGWTPRHRLVKVEPGNPSTGALRVSNAYPVIPPAGRETGLRLVTPRRSGRTRLRDPYGREIRAAGTLAGWNRIRFSTKYHDPETGLVYYGYRFYSPRLGRWMSRDPIEHGDEQDYLFNKNAPACWIDRYGLQSSCTECDQTELDQLVESDRFRETVGHLRNVGCLAGIVCGDCIPGQRGGAVYHPDSGQITVCRNQRVTSMVLAHELQHASQCERGVLPQLPSILPCTHQMPNRKHCSDSLCIEIEAYVCGDMGTGAACDVLDAEFKKEDCIVRAWGSVLLACPRCINVSISGSDIPPRPDFPVRCNPEQMANHCVTWPTP